MTGRRSGLELHDAGLVLATAQPVVKRINPVVTALLVGFVRPLPSPGAQLPWLAFVSSAADCILGVTDGGLRSGLAVASISNKYYSFHQT